MIPFLAESEPLHVTDFLTRETGFFGILVLVLWGVYRLSRYGLTRLLDEEQGLLTAWVKRQITFMDNVEKGFEGLASDNKEIKAAVGEIHSNTKPKPA